MSAVLQAFGIDWRLLIVNAVNFVLLMGALWYFLYHPLTRVLEERRAKVTKGVEDAEAARKKLEEIEAARAGMLADAGKEADEVLAHAREAGIAKERELVSSGQKSASRIVSEAEQEAMALKERALKESKEEMAKLIVLGAEKALLEK